MSDFPLDSNYFVGGQRITPIDDSEGGAALSSLLNASSMSVETELALTGNVDYSAATAAVIQAANRSISTNSGAGRSVTLPDFATAPEGWEHAFLAIDGGSNTLSVVHAGTDTINGVAGDISLNANQAWCRVIKLPDASGWLALGGTGFVPA